MTAARVLLVTGVSCLLSLVTAHHLQMAFFVFRHGERTPADTYPTDPHKDNEFAPFGWGQLSNNGKRQQFEQGQWVKSHYGSELTPKGYRPGLVEARATGVDRTKSSLSLMMAGLYPPEEDQVWNKDLPWQPIPYSSQTLDEDTLLLVRSCPRYAEAYENLLKMEEVKKELESHQDLYKYMTEHAGRNITNPEDVQDVYSTLLAERAFGLELPEWTKSKMDEMDKVTAYSFVLNAYTPEMQKLKAGPMLAKMMGETEAAQAGKNKKKLYAWAGHDSTISNLMMALKVWDPQVPVYNIMAIVEVLTHEDKWGWRVKLRNTTEHDAYTLKMPGCDELCPLEEVKKLLSPLMPEKHKVMCKPKDPNYVAGEEGGP